MYLFCHSKYLPLECVLTASKCACSPRWPMCHRLALFWQQHTARSLKYLLSQVGVDKLYVCYDTLKTRGNSLWKPFPITACLVVFRDFLRGFPVLEQNMWSIQQRFESKYCVVCSRLLSLQKCITMYLMWYDEVILTVNRMNILYICTTMLINTMLLFLNNIVFVPQKFGEFGECDWIWTRQSVTSVNFVWRVTSVSHSPKWLVWISGCVIPCCMYAWRLIWNKY
jgi:hypothetical protein